MVVLSCNILILFIYFIKNKNNIRKYSRLAFYGLAILLTLSIVNQSQIISNPAISDKLNRYLGVFKFSGIMTSKSDKMEYTDSGHVFQSFYATKTLLNNLTTFWGGGYKNDKLFVDYQSVGGIHNNIVYAWSYYGLYMSIFLIINFIIILLNNLLKIYKNKSILNEKIFIVNAIYIYLVVYFIAGWFNGLSPINYLQYFTQYILLLSTSKLLLMKNQISIQ